MIGYRRGAPRGQANIGQLTREIFDPEDYQVSVFAASLPFARLMGPEVKKSPLAAIAWGTRKTTRRVINTYRLLRSMIERRVSTKVIIGPVGIGSAAMRMWRRSTVDFVFLMAMISAIVAVVNFLPIPVLDGGVMVFLIIEKILRKPLSPKVQSVVQMVGLALILFVFVAVTWQDIARLLGQMW